MTPDFVRGPNSCFVPSDYCQTVNVGDVPVQLRWLPLDIRCFDLATWPMATESSLAHPEFTTADSIHGCTDSVLIYSSSSRNSYKSLVETWTKLRRDFETSTPHTTLFEHLWVIANKSDFPWHQQEVPNEAGQRFAEDLGAVFRPASTKTGEGTVGFVSEIARTLIVDAVQ